MHLRLPALLLVATTAAQAAPVGVGAPAAPPPPEFGGAPSAGSPPSSVRREPRADPVLHSHGDPTDEEQLFLELMNRARRDPKAEAARVFRDYGHPDVAGAVDYFLALRPGVEWTRAENRAAFASYPARPPFAFDARLLDVARGHTRRMYEERDQAHQFPGEPAIGARITASGYLWTLVAENVFAYATSIPQAHAAFAIDYGQDVQTEAGDPFQPKGRPVLGHRRALMDFDGGVGYVEVGVGVLGDERPASGVGPLLLTIDFARPADDVRFVTGVCFEDRDGDSFYDPGEGLAGLRVESADTGTLTFTSSSGGYALPVPGGEGTITVVATGEPGGESELIGRVERTVTLAGENVKLDFSPEGDGDPPAFLRAEAADPLPLADGGETVSSLEVTAADVDRATVSDVEVDVALGHPDASDLRVSLESPMGTRVVLADRGLAAADLAGTFGRTLVCDESLSTFVGEPIDGTWTLRVEDAAGGASGSLSRWALRVRPAWDRPLHFDDTTLRLRRFAARGAGIAGAGALLVEGTFDAAGGVAPSPSPVLLRLRRGDGGREELLRLDATAAAAAGGGSVRVRTGLGGTSRGTFRVALRGLDLPPLPGTVAVEVAVAGAVVAQTVPLADGRFDARRSAPVSPAFVVTSIRSRPAGDGRATTVRGRFLDPAADPRGLIEAGVGTGRGSLSPGALKTRGPRSRARTAAALRRVAHDARTGAFAFRLVEDHEAAVEGASRVFLRVGPAYGDAEVRPAVAGKSVRY